MSHAAKGNYRTIPCHHQIWIKQQAAQQLPEASLTCQNIACNNMSLDVLLVANSLQPSWTAAGRGK